MDQQEEASKQVRRKGIIQFQVSTFSFPADLISEVLSKLPLKSLVRFRCVSKLWSSTITDPYFINWFETQSTKRSPSLLVCFKRDDRLFVFSIPQDRQNSNEPHSISSQHVDSYHMPYPKHCSFLPKVSVHGLICYPKAGKTIIWNPILRKLLTLTKPEKSWTDVIVFLGYDPIEVNHKVLCMPSAEAIDECRVLTLGSAQESWRRVKTKHKHHPIPISHVCINGVLYYRACTDVMAYNGVIMSFDVRSEKFHMIKLLWNNVGGRGILTTYEGRLACLKSNDAGYGTTLWILRDAEKHDWSRQNFRAPVCYYDRILKSVFNLIGCTGAGEFVYVPPQFHKSFYTLYYDPKRNRFHRVEYKGIADDESRLKHGLVNRRLCNIHAVPNYIESFMFF